MKKMRKYIALLLSVMTAAMSVNVLAASDDDIKAAMTESITSANMKMTMEIGIEKISDEMKEVFEITGDELPAMSADYDIALKGAADSLVMQMAMNAVVKMTGEPDVDIETYMDMDMSDKNAPKLVYIMKSPDTDKYMVMDYSRIPGYDQLIDSMTAYSPEKIKEINEQIYSAVPDKKFKEKDGVYTMTFTEKEIKDVIESMMLNMEDLMLSTIAVSVSSAVEGEEVSTGEITDEMRSKYEEEVKKWVGALKDVQFFADDAMVITASMDDDKHLKTMGVEINFDTNLYKVIKAVSPIIDDMDETEETKAFIESVTEKNSDISAYLKIDMDISNVNGDVKVEFPKLTEDNSIYLEDMMIDETKINVLYNGIRVKFDDVEPVIENDRTLVPLRKFCNVIGISDENISYEAGVITIKDGRTTLVLTIDDDEVKKTVGDKTETVKLDVPATIRNDRTLVPLRFVSENFSCKVEYEKLEDNPGSVIYINSMLKDEGPAEAAE
ncbi:MAG: copper amine oxidase N-terminal domain-containing protein [Clostridia bacterium]|nr:copper amine oxidase N-terminal domain-containing protein [Clostridia bacterium]